ncbi:MAG: NUDIX domain-containing protein [Myxococcota bacterium]
MTDDEHVRYVVAAAVIVRDGERVLALRRAPHKPGAGLWEVVSGRVDLGEGPYETACREVREETGLEVRIERAPLVAYAGRRANDPMIVIVYGAVLEGGELRRSEEHDDHAWLTAAEFRARSTLTDLVAAVEHLLAPQASP